MNAFLRRWLSRAAKSAKSRISVVSIQEVRSGLSVDLMDNSSAPRRDNPLNRSEAAQESSAANSKCSLVVEALRTHGSCRFQVSGSSMLPTLWPGDLILIQRKPLPQLGLGDIVLHETEGRFFLHRLQCLRTDGDGIQLVTRGDAMPQQDPPFSIDHLLGVLTGVRRAGDWVPLPRRMSAPDRVVAAIARRSSLFSRLLMRAHARRNPDVINTERLAEIS